MLVQRDSLGRAVALVAVAAAMACQPADLSGSITAYVYQFDPAQGFHVLAPGQVDNLESLAHLRGESIELRAGSQITSFNTPLSSPSSATEQWDPGHPFNFEFTLDRSGRVVPGDLQSLNALSVYRAFDRAAQALESHGYVPLRRLGVFYFPRQDSVIAGDVREGFTDNAAFSPDLRGFLIPPYSIPSLGVPVFMNEGVLAHEFGHSVVFQQVFGDAPTLPNAGDADWTIAVGIFSSMGEGVADLFAFTVTGRAAPFGSDVDRRLDIPLDYTDADLAELLAPTDEFDPHYHGSVMARAIYELWPKDVNGLVSTAERGRMVDVILAALPTLVYDNTTFNLASFPDAVVAQLPTTERSAACTVLRQRLAPLANSLPACTGF